MFHATCIYCKKDLKECEPCYPVYNGVVKGYRHINCYATQDLEYQDEIPFGEVVDTNGGLD
jgi:hypothetical protein